MENSGYSSVKREKKNKKIVHTYVDDPARRKKGNPTSNRVHIKVVVVCC